MPVFNLTFIELLKGIQKKPRMYDIRSLRELELFLSGYYLLLEEDNHIIKFETFNSWIKKKHNFQKLNINYVRIIEFISSDSIDSLELFFKEVDIFFKEANLEGIFN